LSGGSWGQYIEACEIAPKHGKCYIFTKSLTSEELDGSIKEGLMLQKQAEVGPTFMGIAMKETSNSDTIALRVTYDPPNNEGFNNIGEGLCEARVQLSVRHEQR